MAMNEIRPRAQLVRDYGEIPTIKASASRLGQVFLNLLLNAAQAIPEGKPAENEIRLTVRAREPRGERDPQACLTIDVRDTGAGISPEVRARIFDPFFTTKPLGQGTGLGLSISHGLVNAMGGELVVASEVGVGTTFRVRLPLTAWEPREREHAGANANGRAAPPVPSVRRARILVIDDEPAIGAVVARGLENLHDVEVMTDPTAAVARIERGERYDLVLCDVAMPERTGMDVHAAIARCSPEQARRMIFLTGGPGSTRAEAFLADPSRVVIEKPFALGALVSRVDAALAELGACERN
jgi:two-component system NtrC family sensor kinase